MNRGTRKTPGLKEFLLMKIDIPLSAKLYDQLDTDKIPYLFWKSTINLEQSFKGITDHDLYIPKAYRKQFEEVLTAQEWVKVISQPWSRYDHVDDYVKYDSSERVLQHLHVHYEAITGAKRVKNYTLTAILDLIIDRNDVEYKHNVRCPKIEWEMIILIIRSYVKGEIWKGLFNNKFITEENLHELKIISSIGNTEIFKNLFLEQSHSKFNEFPRNMTWTSCQVKKHARLLLDTNNFKRCGYLKSFVKSIYRGGLLFLNYRLGSLAPIFSMKKKFSHRNPIFAIVGIDGAGKSHQVNATMEVFQTKLSVKKFYMGSGEGYKTGNSLREFRKKRSVRKLKKIFPENFFSDIFHLIVALKNLWQLQVAKIYSRSGWLVILDRFPHTDKFALNDGAKCSNKFFLSIERYLITAACRTENVKIIRLDVSPSTSIVRGKENTLEELQVKAAWLKYSFPQALVVDAEPPISEVTADICETIFKNIS